MGQTQRVNVLRLAVVIMVIFDGAFGTICALDLFPPELSGSPVKKRIIEHFCTNRYDQDLKYSSSSVSCASMRQSFRKSCDRIGALAPCPEADQCPFCMFEDVSVCQYEDGSGSCMYSISSSIPPFCICKINGSFPTSNPEGPASKRSCKEGQPTTPGSQPTTLGSQHTTLKGGAKLGGSSPVITSVIVSGVILSLLVLMVILVVVCRTREKLFCMHTDMRTGHQTTDELEAHYADPEDHRDPQTQEQPVSDSLEYAYASYPDQLSATPKTAEPNTYSNVNQDKKTAQREPCIKQKCIIKNERGTNGDNNRQQIPATSQTGDSLHTYSNVDQGRGNNKKRRWSNPQREPVFEQKDSLENEVRDGEEIKKGLEGLEYAYAYGIHPRVPTNPQEHEDSLRNEGDNEDEYEYVDLKTSKTKGHNV